MPILMTEDTACFEGICAIEEAERLLDWLRERGPRARVDLSACEHLHTAVLQTLLALRPALAKSPPDRGLLQALSRLPAISPEDG